MLFLKLSQQRFIWFSSARALSYKALNALHMIVAITGSSVGKRCSAKLAIPIDF